MLNKYEEDEKIPITFHIPTIISVIQIITLIFLIFEITNINSNTCNIVLLYYVLSFLNWCTYLSNFDFHKLTLFFNLVFSHLISLILTFFRSSKRMSFVAIFIYIFMILEISIVIMEVYFLVFKKESFHKIKEQIYEENLSRISQSTNSSFIQKVRRQNFKEFLRNNISQLINRAKFDYPIISYYLRNNFLCTLINITSDIDCLINICNCKFAVYFISLNEDEEVPYYMNLSKLIFSLSFLFKNIIAHPLYFKTLLNSYILK
jgi:hypothetical protein